MRVAVIFNEVPPESGGAFTFQAALVASLALVESTSQHSFVFYMVAGGGSAPEGYITIPQSLSARSHRTIITAIRDGYDRLNLRRPRWRTWFERSLESQKVDFVWFASNYIEDCGQPFFCTVWDLAHVTTPWFPEVSKDGEWERRQHYYGRMLPKAARIIVSNEAGRRAIQQAFPVADERFICLPMPTPDFALDAMTDTNDLGAKVSGLGVTQPYLFYPAQYWAHKNHVGALRALAQARRGGQRDDLSLVFVGSDKGQEAFLSQEASNLGLSEHVHFLGFVTVTELVALYREAHALLYLSFFGPENLPPLEALALSCPVICSDVPGMREQLGDAAVFVAPTDPSAAAIAVEGLFRPEQRAHLVEKGLELAAERTAGRYVARVLRELDEFDPIRSCWS